LGFCVALNAAFVSDFFRWLPDCLGMLQSILWVVKVVDINADVGEGCGFDALLMKSITSASVAAGYHAGSPKILRETICLAKAHGVSVGAHPGFRDRENFGRRELPITPAEAEALIREQIEILATAAAAEGVRLQHVKPHGALYNMAAGDRSLADAIARAVRACDPSLILFAPRGSQLFAAGQAAGLRVAAEVFADRGYAADGSLIPRGAPGAIIEDVDLAVAQALRMEADTICAHGDTAGCDVLAAKLRAALVLAGRTPTAFRSYL
jgi:5-oxoprolinase (ATP-hydrolysing) subunit A